MDAISRTDSASTTFVNDPHFLPRVNAKRAAAIRPAVPSFDIVPVVESAGVSLRRHGKELRGLCPLHADKNPSLDVNPETNRWYCYACAEGGDAIRFVERLHRVSFKDALKKLLGANGTAIPRRPSDSPTEKSRRISGWARELSRRISAELREIGDEIRVCRIARQQVGVDGMLIAKHEAGLIRRWALLCDLDDDLANPETAIELWKERGTLEALVDEL
jgi:hypothetical protein